MEHVEDGLFDLEGPAKQEEAAPALMTPPQRQAIRELFAQLGVTDARAQFDMVAELTGARIASVAELEAGPANVLIQMLRGRAARSGRVNTGNAWADRDEDTWIDRL
jgi:DNA polymerase-3 subunit epsilon